MNLFAFAQRHLRAILTLVLALFAAGVLASLSLPVGLFPNVSFPRIAVSADAGELPPEQMMVQVTRPLEEALSGVPGVSRVRSATSRGACDLSANFGWGADMTQTTLLVQAAVAQARSNLPPGTEISVRRMDPTVFPVVAYSLTSQTLSQTRLRELANLTLRPLLLRVPGVARVGVLGGDQREFEVELDPAKLQARNLSADAVAEAIRRGNRLDSSGLLPSGYRLFLTLTDGRADSARAIAALPVSTNQGGQSVSVGDLGRVVESTVPRFTRVIADGHEAVLINVYQQPGGNTVALDAGVRDTLQHARALLPPGATLSQYYNQAELISDAMGSVRDSILVGVLLGIGLIWLFLRKARLTLLAALSVPLTLGITILLLQALHLTFNVMTLGGLAAAVGLILDDAIVMLENVARHLHLHESPAAAARHASDELRKPFLGSSLSTLVVFAPLAFLTGVTGAFFRSLSLTMAAALAVSWVVAVVVLPPVAAKLLTHKDAEDEPPANSRLDRGYTRLLSWLLPRPWVAGLASLALVAGTVGLYLTLPNGFLPGMDEGAFILDFITPPGTSVAESDRLLKRVETVLGQTPEVASYSRRMGLQLGEGLTEPNTGDYLVKLKPQPRKAIEKVIADVRERVSAQLPGVDMEFSQLMEDLIGDLTAVPEPIEVKVVGADTETDQRVARQVAELLPKVPGVVDIRDGVVVAGPTLRAVVDPQAAGRYGLSSENVANALETAVEGTQASEVLQNGQVVGIRVRLGEPGKATPASLADTPVPLPQGGVVPLSAVAQVVEDPGTTEIGRENLQNMVAVTARLEGGSLGGSVAAIRKLLNQKLTRPPGVSLEYGGLYAEQQESFKGLLGVLAAAFVLVMLVLLFEFGSFGTPLAILAVAATSLFGVLAALALTGTPLNVSSMMGAVMIVGIVAENAIFFVHYVHDFTRRGWELEDALVEAGRVRMRPVAMTALAAILALTPLALGLGAGAQMQQPLAIAVIGGFALSSLLILLLLPVLYRVVSRRKQALTPLEIEAA